MPPETVHSHVSSLLEGPHNNLTCDIVFSAKHALFKHGICRIPIVLILDFRETGVLIKTSASGQISALSLRIAGQLEVPVNVRVQQQVVQRSRLKDESECETPTNYNLASLHIFGVSLHTNSFFPL